MNGATYQEMACRKKISYSYLRGLMTGTNPPEKLSLDVLFKLFPKATINLHGGASGSNGNVADIDDQILDIFRAEYDRGFTQQEIAAKHHTTQGQIQSLLSGKRQVAGLTLGTIMKMFPGATLVLSGDPDDFDANSTVSDWRHIALQKILETEELNDAEKIKVVKVLKK